MKLIEIKTKRLTLKQLTLKDKRRLIELLGDARVSETLSRVPYPYTDDDAQFWLHHVSQNPLDLNIFCDNLLIGGIGLKPEVEGACELGYWLGFEYWGEGYATEACKGLLDYAKKSTTFNSCQAAVVRGNAASIKVLEKVGFKLTGAGEVFSLSKQQKLPSLRYECKL